MVCKFMLKVKKLDINVFVVLVESLVVLVIKFGW